MFWPTAGPRTNYWWRFLACQRQAFLLTHCCWGKFRKEERHSATIQKFHTNDVNQRLYDKSGSDGVPNANLFNFTFLLVDFGQVLCSFTNELQQNSNASFGEEYIPQVLTVLLYIHYIYFAFCLLSIICKQWLEQYNYSDVQSVLMTGFQTDIMSSVWNFCRWVTDVPPRKTSLSGNEQGETSAVRRLESSWLDWSAVVGLPFHLECSGVVLDPSEN